MFKPYRLECYQLDRGCLFSYQSN